MSEEDKAYLAGVIDSDGSIGIYKTKTKISRGYQYLIKLQITWKKEPESLRFFEEIKAHYGGSVMQLTVRPTNFLKKESFVYKYSAESRQTYNILIDIYPHMRIKKARAGCIMEMVETRGGRGGSTGRFRAKTDEQWDKEDEIYQRSLKLRSSYVG